MISLPGRRPRPLATPAGLAARLDGTVSVITGGSRGIGRVLAQALADAGAAVGLIARSDTELAETVRLVEACGGTAAAASADITDQQAAAGAIDALRRQLGPADLLVNNAGVSGPFGDAWQVDAEEWWRAVEINLRGVFLCSRAVLPDMTARGAGRRRGAAAGLHQPHGLGEFDPGPGDQADRRARVRQRLGQHPPDAPPAAGDHAHCSAQLRGGRGGSGCGGPGLPGGEQAGPPAKPGDHRGFPASTGAREDAAAWSRPVSRRRRILPDGDLGISVTNSTRRIFSCGATRSAT